MTVISDLSTGPRALRNWTPFARFYLSCHLRTTGSHVRPAFVEICPYLRYSNQTQNGYLTKEEVDLSSPPPPPPDAADDDNIALAGATSSMTAPTQAKKTRSRKNKKAADPDPVPPAPTELQDVWAAQMDLANTSVLGLGHSPP